MNSGEYSDTDDFQVRPSSSVDVSTSNEKTFQNGNFLYTQFQQHVSVYEQLSQSRETSPELRTPGHCVRATVISPPHHRQISSIDFSPSAPSSPSSILYSPQPTSCSNYHTNPTFLHNHLYQHSVDPTGEIPAQQKYSTQAPTYRDTHEHFFNTISDNINTSNTCLSLQDKNISELLSFQSLPFETDQNNNHQQTGDINESRRNAILDFKITNSKACPGDNLQKFIKLPPFAALLSNHSEKPVIPESSNATMIKQDNFFDTADDTDVHLSSSFSSVGEETHYINLTNVIQSRLEDQSCMADTPELNYLEWSCDPEYSLKTEPSSGYEIEDFFYPEQNTAFTDPCDEMNLDSPTTDSDGYSSSVERDSTFSQCLSLTNAADVAYDSGSKTTSYSGHDSSSSDEGYGEGTIPEYKLPDFAKLQNSRTDPDKIPQHKYNKVLHSKDKKKSVRESLHYVEKVRQKPGRKPGQVSNVLHLWEFMRDLLHSSENKGIIEWISKTDGVFRVMNSTEVARLWGEKKKNKKEMTYEKLSRSLRYSRLEGYFANLPRDKNYPKKLCFMFGPKSRNWR